MTRGARGDGKVHFAALTVTNIQTQLVWGGREPMGFATIELVFWGETFWKRTNEGRGRRKELQDFVRGFVSSSAFEVLQEYSTRGSIIRGATVHEANPSLFPEDPPAELDETGALGAIGRRVIREEEDRQRRGEPPSDGARFYVIVLPPATKVRLENGIVCETYADAYHGSIAQGVTIPYAVIPYCDGNLDRMQKSIGHEIAEIITNPAADVSGWTFAKAPPESSEISDRCGGVTHSFGFGTVEGEWSNTQEQCATKVDLCLKEMVVGNIMFGPEQLFLSLELFGIMKNGKGTAAHRWQSTANQGWGPLATLGGRDLHGLTIGRNADSRLEVFALDSAGVVNHCYQLPPAGDFGVWAGVIPEAPDVPGYYTWSTLGGHALQQLSTATDLHGRLNLLALGGDGYVYLARQSGPNGGFLPWTGVSNEPGNLFGRIVAAEGSGRIDLFALATNGTPFASHSIGEGWAQWLTEGVVLAPLHRLVASPEVGGERHLFGLGPDGALHWRVRGRGLFWNWAEGTHDCRELAVAVNADGTLSLLVLGGDNNVYLFRQRRDLTFDWQSPRFLRGLPRRIERITTGRNADGRLELFVLDEDGRVSHRWQEAPSFDTWTGWFEWSR